MTARKVMRVVMGVAAALGAIARGQDAEPPATPQGAGVYERASVVVDGVNYPYLLLTPPEGAEAPAEGWPLVVFLHGAGERGDDNQAQARHFPERMAGEEYRERFGCYLLALQCPAGDRWAAFDWRSEEGQRQTEEPAPPLRAVMRQVETLVAERDIDLRRIYLTGLSMGGFGSWDLAARKPGWFAAVVPVCGGGDPDIAAAYKGLPVWAWHDADDPVVPVSLTRKMVEAARAAGAEVRYDEVTGYGHASWVAAYDADKAPAWMFVQRREEPAAELVSLRVKR